MGKSFSYRCIYDIHRWRVFVRDEPRPVVYRVCERCGELERKRRGYWFGVRS